VGSQTRLPFARNRNEDAYQEWAATHKDVIVLFLQFARERLASGRRFGIGALTERVRWEVATTWGPDKSGFKINNNHRAYLARDLLKLEPRLARLVTTRRVKGDS
jgi:hypothetical protein